MSASPSLALADSPAAPEAPAPDAPPAPPAPPQRWLPAIKIEVDVTPRSFAPGPSFDDDLLSILATWREASGDLRRMMVDFQAGLSGVRFVLAVPSGVSTDAIEEARAKLKAALDALDFSSARRRAVTEAREEAAAKRTRSLRAVPGPEKAPPGPPPAAGNAAPPAEPATEPPPAGPAEPPPEEPAPISGTGTTPRSDPPAEGEPEGPGT